MCNSSVINISRVSLPPCQVLKVDLGQPIQIQLMDSAELWDSTYYEIFEIFEAFEIFENKLFLKET